MIFFIIIITFLWNYIAGINQSGIYWLHKYWLHK